MWGKKIGKVFVVINKDMLIVGMADRMIKLS